MKYVILGLTCISQVIGFSQSSNPVPIPCSQVGPGQSLQTDINAPSCIKDEGNDSQVVTMNLGSQIEWKAGEEIFLDGEVNLAPSSNGEFYAHIQRSEFEQAWFEPNATPGEVRQYEKLEIGVRMNSEIRQGIKNYIDTLPGDLINPFNPEDISVEANFTPDPSNDPSVLTNQPKYKVYGFYYKEFERDISDADAHNWDWNDVTTDSISSDYCFRVRFAPPAEGLYLCEIKIEYNGNTVVLPTFTFNAMPPVKHGYTTLGANNRYLVQDEKNYYPSGRNMVPICWEDPDLNPDYQCDSLGWTNQRYSPGYFLSFLDNLQRYREAGGEFFRMLFFREDFEIEFEHLNNYYKRLNSAWEFDRVVELCEEIGLDIDFTTMNHTHLMRLADFDIFSDWNQGSLTPVHSSNPPQWTGDPECVYPDDVDWGYCYSRELSISDPEEFLTDPEARKFWQYRLRYITSRWGYSPKLVMVGVVSEANNIGVGGELLWTGQCTRINVTKPYPNDPTLGPKISEWHGVMAQYLKTHQHFPHLVSAIFTGTHNNGMYYGDESYLQEYIDVAGWNDYRGTWDNYSGVSDYFYQLMGESTLQYNTGADSGHFYVGNMDKPLVTPEMGLAMAVDCDEGVHYIKDLWIRPFCGVAYSLNWYYRHNFDPHLMSHHGRLKEFLGNVRLDGDQDGPWLPHWDRRNDSLTSVYYMRSQDNHARAMGVISNNTVNYGSKAETAACLDRYGTQDMPPPTFLTASPVVHAGGNNRIQIDGMGSFRKNTIEFYDITTGDLIESYTGRSNIAGKFRVKHPELSESSYGSFLLGFKLRHHNEPSFFAQDTDNWVLPDNDRGHSDDEEYEQKTDWSQVQMAEELTEISIFPNPASEFIEIQTNNSENLRLEIYDANGKKFEDKRIVQNMKVNIVEYDSGVYFIKVSSDSNTWYKKFVKL